MFLPRCSVTLSSSGNWRFVSGWVNSRVFKPGLECRKSWVSPRSSPKGHRLLHCENSAQSAPGEYLIANQETVCFMLLQFLGLSERGLGHFLKHQQESLKPPARTFINTRWGGMTVKCSSAEDRRPGGGEGLQMISPAIMPSSMGAVGFEGFVKMFVE